MPNDAFQIYQVKGFGKGTLGVCRQPAADEDFAMISAWNPTVVATLTAEEEFPGAGKSLPQHFLEAKFDWLHLPITDFGVPPETENDIWDETLTRLGNVLNAGGRVLAHCKGGQGRSGMVILKLLVLQGENGKTALGRIRKLRAGAVETDAQYAWATNPFNIG